MADNVLSQKDVKDILEEGLKTTQSKWDEKRAEDKQTFDSKVKEIMNTIEGKEFSTKSEVEKAVTEAREKIEGEMDEQIGKIKKGLLSGHKKSGSALGAFKSGIADLVKGKHSDIVEAAQSGRSLKFEMKDFNWADFTGDTGLLTTDVLPLRANPYGGFHWRNILPVGSTSEGNLAYPQEDATVGGAAAWEHTGDATTSKPEIEPKLTVANNKVEWIAGLIKGIPIDMLEDLNFLTSYLQTKAINELLIAEDNEIAKGNGTSPHLDGLIPNATAYDDRKTVFIEKIIDASYRQVAASNYDANFAVISDSDKVDVLLNKNSGAGYDLPGGSVSVVNGVLNVAGLNIYSTSKMNVGEALVGDASQAMITFRDNPRVRMFETNKDDAEKNQVMLRVEERLALAIFAKTAFVYLNGTT